MRTEAGFTTVEAAVALLIAALAFVASASTFALLQASVSHASRIHRAALYAAAEAARVRALPVQFISPARVDPEPGITVETAVHRPAPGLVLITVTASASSPGWPAVRHVTVPVYRREVSGP